MKRHGTTVTFRKRSDGNCLGFNCEGHSGYAEAGQDIVCAALSALTQAAFHGLKDVLKAPVMYDVRDEDAFLEVMLTPEATESQIQQAQLLLKTLEEAVQGIAAQYPKNVCVRVIFKERR